MKPATNASTRFAAPRTILNVAGSRYVFLARAAETNGAYSAFEVFVPPNAGIPLHAHSNEEEVFYPLTTITAWEMLFDRLRVDKSVNESLLIVGGAGGVGSIAIQLAKQLTNLSIIATASRSETQDWCRRMGAHHVINHAKPLSPQVKAIVRGGVKYVLALTRTEDHFEELVEAMAPQSAMALIENPARPLDIAKLKPKSISLHWEFMFTRSRYQTPDMGEQGRLLNDVADLVEAGSVQSTLRMNLGTINAANMKRAHALVESGKTVGKIVLAGFSS